MSRISFEGSYESVEVDLWGHTFETVDSTRSVHQKVAELEKKADEATTDDEGIECIAKMLDLKLKPVSHKDEAKRPVKASKLVVEKWKADELSVSKIMRFFYAIGEAEERPT